MPTSEQRGRDDGLYPVPPGVAGTRSISPTDVSQFIRLDQCERYLRLRLHQRVGGEHFLRDYGVAPQSIPPLLTESGGVFEATVARAIGEQYAAIDLAAGRDAAAGNDNARVIATAAGLAPGAVAMLLQPRIVAELEGWRIRGDIDLLRLERDAAGRLRVVIVDIKSSTAVKIEHRLQVAFYLEMLAAIFAGAGTATEALEIAILYRGPVAPTGQEEPDELDRRAAEAAAADDLFNMPGALLEIIPDPETYRETVRDLVTGERSRARRVAEAPFTEIPYHLTYKCDGCLYNEFCMKSSAERDDLSLLPHLSDQEKIALQRGGVETVREMAHLKEPRRDPLTGAVDLTTLVAAPGQERRVRRLGATWPVGPRLDELVHRARAYRKFKGEEIAALSYIPSKGYGSLPYCAPDHDPNLVRVYLDAQHDYLHDRIYLLGSLVVAAEGGVEARRRSIVHLADGPPESAETEERLFVAWISDTLRAIVELAAPDANGEPKAPIHLIFFDQFDQRLLLDGLGRHFGSVLGATPLYDFVTQLAAYDSPVATFLSQEIQELKNYPMVCQSLQAVAARLRFDWNAGTPYRDLFRSHLFDFWRKIDEEETAPGESPWYTGRARFNSQIPLEYAYAAWEALPPPALGERDEYAPYRGVDTGQLRGFQARRLEAIEAIAGDFQGNKRTEKRDFDLPSLAAFDQRARGLATALDEFLTIERHVELGAWKGARLAPPERRVLAGDSLLVRYDEADQDPGIAETNRENERRRQLQEARREAYRAENPDAKQVRLSKEQRAESDWSQEGLRVRLRLDMSEVDAGLDEVLGLTRLRTGDQVILIRRWTTDSRLPLAEQETFQPTAKQLLYGTRAAIAGLEIERDATGMAVAGRVLLDLQQGRGKADRGYAFAPRPEPLVPGETYTLDDDPNNWYGSFLTNVIDELGAGDPNTLFSRLEASATARVDWPDEAVAGQARFLAGLDAMADAGAMHSFAADTRPFIGENGATPTLLVQGPPGTGKSYSTAFALYARLQGAMAAGRDFRVMVGCKTHAATGVLLDNLLAVQARLAELREREPAIFAAHFDARLLDVPMFRLAPRGPVPAGVVALPRKRDRERDDPRPVDLITAAPRCLIAATPGGVYGLIKDQWSKPLAGHELIDCLVLDEASQMNLPEAIMAALPLKPDGHLIVVGDHRQMPPIVKHDWEGEPRRTFREYATYRSLFDALRRLGGPMIQFAESFRLHADTAEFLRQEIYRLDGIAYHSRRQETVAALAHDDAFVAGVLSPEHPLVVIVHDEDVSQLRNPFERELIMPLMDELTARGLDVVDGLGVVVPHRAQRALLQTALRSLVTGAGDGAGADAAVDTIERFQGGERDVIIVSATESDRQYLLAASAFLLDPRRLTVAISRAKHKLILVAARSIFELFSADEETFQNARLWKNLLRRTCTVRLWQGERDGTRVEVWGNALVARLPNPDRETVAELVNGAGVSANRASARNA